MLLWLLPIEPSDAVGLAVSDEDRSIAIDEDPMQPCKFALERITHGSVPFGSRSCHQLEIARFCVDHSDGVAFGVSQPSIPL